jgi:hypothetical protein
MTTQTCLPDSFAAGTTVKYTLSVPDCPASAGWALTLLLAGAGKLAVTASASGDAFAVTITAAQGAALAAGVYQWAHEVSKAGEVYRVGEGTVVVTPNMNTAAAGDLQSPNEKLLAAITAVLSSRYGATTGVAKDVEAYQLDGITVTKVPTSELEKARTRLAYAVSRAKNGGQPFRQHRIAFTRPE